MTYGHTTKNAIFTDCAAPRNLQPTSHFRPVYPGGDCFDKDDGDIFDWPYHDNDSFNPGQAPEGPNLYFSPGDTPLHESTRIGDLDNSSSLNLQISDDTPAPSRGWKTPKFGARPPRSRKSSWRQNSNDGTPSSSAASSRRPSPPSSTASSRRPSRSRSEGNRKRQKANTDQASPIFRE